MYISRYVHTACRRGITPAAAHVFEGSTTPTDAASSRRLITMKGLIMKILFSLKDKLTSKKSLKAYAWYIWY
ncbi:tryptorubin family RiPP precursor [Burkholderia alba]|uniref:tryptorubin family RiPP precursor n=1 Tax=Burkholderia alba TaxID=2683677 RepID=UPI00389940AB